MLGGGGTLGAVQVGFVRRLNELAIPIDIVVGTSVGALNAAYVAFTTTTATTASNRSGRGSARNVCTAGIRFPR